MVENVIEIVINVCFINRIKQNRHTRNFVLNNLCGIV